MSSFTIHPLDPQEIAALLLGAHADLSACSARIARGRIWWSGCFVRKPRRCRSSRRPIESQVFPAERLHIEGLYQATVPDETRIFSYYVKVIAFDGSEQTLRDPYSYGPMMGEVDLHLFAEGNG